MKYEGGGESNLPPPPPEKLPSKNLNNLCIAVRDPCLPWWKLQVEELVVNDKRLIRKVSKQESNSSAVKIVNWIWETRILAVMNAEGKGGLPVKMYFFFFQLFQSSRLSETI